MAIGQIGLSLEQAFVITYRNFGLAQSLQQTGQVRMVCEATRHLLDQRDQRLDGLLWALRLQVEIDERPQHAFTMIARACELSISLLGLRQFALVMQIARLSRSRFQLFQKAYPSC